MYEIGGGKSEGFFSKFFFRGKRKGVHKFEY